MQRILLIAAILSCTMLTSVNAQSPFYAKHYVEQGEISDEVTHITTQDGGNLIASVQHPVMTANYSITLFKADADGVIQWSKGFPTDRPGFHNVVQSTDGTYFLCYSEFPFGNYYEAIRLDQNGNVIFDKRINLPPLYHVTWKTSVVPKMDSGYYVSCSVFDTTTSTYQWNVMELSAGGNVVWTKNYNADAFLGGLSGMSLCSNGDILLMGSEYDIPTQAYAGMITRVASNGNLVWNTRFSNAGHDLYPITSMAQGSGFIVLVQDYQQSAGLAAADFMKIDSAGSLVWEMRYTNTGPNSSLLPHDLIVSGGGDFVAIAQRSGPDLGSVFLQVDASGQYVSSRFYPDYTITSIDNYGQWMYSLTGTKDSINDHYAALKTVDGAGAGCNDTTAAFGFGPVTFVATSGGTATNFSLTSVNGNLALVNANPVLYTDCVLTGMNNNLAVQSGISLYPVPANDALTIQSASQIISLEIADVHGAVVYAQTVNSHTCNIPTASFANGIYFVHVTDSRGVKTIRSVIAR